MIKRIAKDTYTYIINDVTYHVYFVGLPTKIINEKAVKSYIKYKDCSIYIDPEISMDNQLHCLIHEITHSVVYETQLSLDLLYTEEQLCELMAIYGDFIINTAKKIIKQRKRYDV